MGIIYKLVIFGDYQMNEWGDCNLEKIPHRLFYNLTGVALTGLLQVYFISLVKAQVTPDNTLGNSPSVVKTQAVDNLLIEGGARNNSNLFHSFQEFNINNGQQVFFANPQGVNNIITRITGNSPSTINGLLGVNGLANLFLINPKGIIFGNGSSLDVNGSFIGSTAESVIFSDGNIFSAIQPNNPSLLKINLPLGLQYGANPAAIQLQQANLEVKSGKTLGLIGGNVSLNNATLKAPGGKIQLGGLLAEGTVNLNNFQSFSFPEGVKLGDVSLTNRSNIDVMDAGGGDIFVDANNFTLINSNFMAGIKAGLGNKDVVAGDIDINTTGDINIDAESNISNVLEENSLGNSGKIDIKANNFFLKDSNILSNTNSVGNAGDLNIEVSNKFEIISSPINLTRRREGRKGLFSQAEENATGNGGNITVIAQDITISGIGGISSSSNSSGNSGKIIIEGDRLNIIEGAAVLSNTNSSGNAGEIFIKTSEFIEISDKLSDAQFADISRPPGGIIADVRRGGRGNGGKIIVETPRLTVRDGGFITTDTKGSGDGGDINIRATELVEVIGRGENRSSVVIAAVRRNSRGEGGNLLIETKNLIVRDGGEINVGTDSRGNSGNLTVRATESVVLGGLVNTVPSGLIAQVGVLGSGDGGNITVETGKIILADGAQISASNLGKGNSGNVNILAGDAIEIIGSSLPIESLTGRGELVKDETGTVFPSGIFTSSPGAGNSGDLNIETGKLTLEDNAQISVSSQQEGAAGNLQIQGNQIYLNNATISAETVAGDKGSISLKGADIRLRQGSRITTNATQTATGGNIDIDSLTLVGLENSDITANAENNFGGRVVVNAEGIFGIQFRDFLTPESDITATSALGAEFNGVVEVNTPDIDPTSALEELPKTFTDSSQQIKAGCPADGGNYFAETGRGGLPKSPQGVLRSEVVMEDWRVSVEDKSQGEEVISKIQKQQNQFTPIVEARGWIVNEEGVVEFVANLPEDNVNFGNRLVDCG